MGRFSKEYVNFYRLLTCDKNVWIIWSFTSFLHWSYNFHNN